MVEFLWGGINDYCLIQDADRSCSPADCAIKYNGKRNYYRNSTGKCEKVTKCDTRGGDGVSVVAVSWY